MNASPQSVIIETASSCNRTCRDCLRQTYTDRERISRRFDNELMDRDIFNKIITELKAMHFMGRICLSFFNEPLMDGRLGDLARQAHTIFPLHELYANTNGDLLNKHLAAHLDGAFDRLNVALYGDHKAERTQELCAMFKQTRLSFTGGIHVLTHYGPYKNIVDIKHEFRQRPCIYEAQTRQIIRFDGEMVQCCEDIAGEWDLGNVKLFTLEQLWRSTKHEQIVDELSQTGGRRGKPYCEICPRP